MLKVLRAAVAALCFASVAIAAEVKPYANEDLASDAVRLAETLKIAAGKIGAQTAGKTPDDLRKAAAAAATGGKFDAAAALAAAAATAGPKDPANWLAYANVAIKADDAQADNRWDLVTHGAAAAYAAYERAAEAPAQAVALATLGDLLARHSAWRGALDAYKASLDRRDAIDVRKTYESLREQYGFRILDYKVDNESANPRVCFTFSEQLARKTDFAPYVAVSGASSAAISSEDQQICVEGLKHGERYAVVLRQGLPSAVGENLLKAADYEIYVRDRSPQAHFAGKAYVLPRQGQEGAPLVTVNASKVSIDVYRIGDRNLLATVNRDDFLKPIDTARAREIADTDGVKVWSGSMDVASELNRDVVTEFPVLKAVGKLDPGVYLVTARPWKEKTSDSDEPDYAQLATQWMVVSDLGLTAISGDDGVHAFVQSLGSAGPLAGVDVTLVARNNEALATKTTGADGRVEFDPGLSRGKGGVAPGLLVATLAGDYNFLNLAQNAFDLTDRGVGGRDAPSGLDAFVYTERGVYRSGETVFATALLRDAKGVARERLPLTLVVKRPDGVEYRRATVADAGLGGHALAIPLLAGAAPGKWRIEAFADPKGDPIGAVEFLLEDYIPERLDFALKTASAVVTPGEPIALSLDARFLYGAPASGLDVTGAIRVQAVPDGALAGFPGYVAGLADDEFTTVETQFPAKATTDAKGRAELSVDLPEAASTRPLEAKLIVDVAEPGGRTVERTVTLPVRAKGVLVGVKKTFDASISAGDAATFEAIAVAPDGARVARKGAEWSLYQVTSDYQWFNADGRWNYEPVKSSKRVASGIVDIGPDGPAKISAPVQWGAHRLDIKTLDGEETSLAFDVGWSGTASADTPDNVAVTLDKTSYAPGDEAKLRIAAAAAGKATVALIGDKVERFIDVDLAAGDTVVPFAVGADWGPGAYAVALTHRPLDVKARRMPGRAIGLAWFSIGGATRKLDVTFDAPAIAKPREPMQIPITVAGLAPGEEAYVSVSAVDLGILNLTGYRTPDPVAYFFGQRKLPVEIRDLWGMLIDGMQGAAGAIETGGDSSGSLEGNLPTQPPLALFSGVVRLDDRGQATVTFDLPAFNGTVRLAAAAWSRDKVGSAQSDVTVRDKVVVSATLPRFLDVGDRSQLTVDIDNVDGEAGDYTLDLDLGGPVAAEAAALHQTLRLDAHQRRQATVAIAAAGVGTASFGLRLSGPNVDLTQKLALGVASGAPDVYRRTVTPLPGGGAATVSGDLLAGFIPGTGSIAVSASPFGALDAPALLQALDRYPYGCSEQTVSRAMPLLYVNRLASLQNLGVDPDLDARIKQAIEREMSRQSASGAFGMWAADSGDDDPWLDAFVTDFLTRAREMKFVVAEPAFAQALDRLRNTIVNAPEPNADNSAALAYALYVLARNGRPVIGDLRYLSDAKLDAFASPLAKAQLGAALAMLGDRARAGKVFSAALAALAAEKDEGRSRPDFGSRLRDAAAVMALVAEADPAAGDMPANAIARAGAELDSARAERSQTSTQENGWMVLAAEALAEHGGLGSFTVDGQPVKGALNRRFGPDALAGKTAAIGNAGEATAQLVVTVSGSPVAPEPAASNGYTVERSFYTLDGKKLDLASLMQNQRVVVALRVTEAEARTARLMIVDRLPAGLEIDNPALVEGGSVEGFSWLTTDETPAHTEYRDDRFVAVFDRAPGQSAFITLAYVVRAVAPGRYVHPPATAEDMYAPERYGRTAFGAMEVTAK
ncbi:alpha-2-macroglobulin family protein [Roseiarcus fermentans]|nr:alpha-2-macroglobulin [Roseiarcus fermentans]